MCLFVGGCFLFSRLCERDSDLNYSVCVRGLRVLWYFGKKLQVNFVFYIVKKKKKEERLPSPEAGEPPVQQGNPFPA